MEGQPRTTLDVGDQNKGITLGLLSTSVQEGQSVAVYRVTNVNGNTDGLNLIFDGFEFDSAAVAEAHGVTVSFSAETENGLPLDTNAKNRSVELVEVIDQFSQIGSDFFSKTIDVESGRVKFVDTAEDEAGFNLTGFDGEDLVFTTPDLVASFTGRDFTLGGNFAWLLDDEGELRPDILTINCGTGNAEPQVSLNEIVFNCDDQNSDTFITTLIKFDTSSNDVVIPTQSFTYETTVSYSGANTSGTKTLSGDAGSWDLNGSQVQVSYMPYRSDISQVINLSSSDSQSGAISVTAYPESGDPIELGEIATAQANGMVQLAGPIADALTAATGFNHRTSETVARYAFEITTVAPAGSVEVYSAYNVGKNGARLVVNDSNGGAVSKQLTPIKHR